MGLPKVKHATYVAELSCGDVKYRPFVHAEQKVIMQVKETESFPVLLDNIASILKAVTFNEVDVDALSPADFNKLLLAVRAKSVGEIIPIQFKCPKCEHQQIYKINLDEDVVEVGDEEVSNKVHLFGDMYLILKQPGITEVRDGTSDDATDVQIFKMFADCVVDGDEVTYFNEVDDEDVEAFKDDLSLPVLAHIEKYQKAIKQTAIRIHSTCDECSHEHTEDITELESFLA